MVAEINCVFIDDCVSYLPGLKNSVPDALSRQPSEVGWPDEGDIL